VVVLGARGYVAAIRAAQLASKRGDREGKMVGILPRLDVGAFHPESPAAGMLNSRTTMTSIAPKISLQVWQRQNGLRRRVQARKPSDRNRLVKGVQLNFLMRKEQDRYF
jgi:hypothetical protein